MNPRVLEAILIAGSLAIWFGVYGLALLATRPETPPAAPATEDLGPEPPAVVSLLVNRWEITEDAAESTLLDLGARHILEFRQPANDPAQTTVHVRQPNPVGLAPWEQRVFDRIVGLAIGGVVPLTALTFRDPTRAAAWSKQLRAEIVAEARGRGLSRRRISPRLLVGLAVAAAIAAIGVTAGVAHHMRDTGDHDLRGAFGIGFFAFIALTAIAGRSTGERDTEAGRAAASRWLGVRAWLRGHDAFAELPPAAVTVWDRYLSYGAAVGATRVSSAVIDLGMGNRRRVWSSFGGTWHRVRVRYPRFWPRYGKTAPKLIIKAAIVGVVGALFVHYWYGGVARALSIGSVRTSPVDAFVGLIKSAGLLFGLALIGYGVYVLARTIVDLAAPVAVTGEVVWTEVWRSDSGGENSPPTPWLHYLAVDDGVGDSTRAWGLPVTLPRCDNGDTVTMTARRWSRRVVTLTIDERGAEHRMVRSTVGAANENTEQMIAVAMGLPGQAGLSSNPLGTMLSGLMGPLTPMNGPLLTPDEVGAALGHPVTVRAATPAGNSPMEVSEYLGPAGETVLTVTRSGGLVGRMTMRGRRSGQEIGGIGEEARGGPGWVVARRGQDVVMMYLDGAAAARTPPNNLAGLLYTAVNRIPAATP